MTVIKTFVQASTLATAESVTTAALPKLKLLLQQLDSSERKQLLLQEFSAELDSLIKHETESAVASAVQQANVQQQQRLTELEAEQRDKMRETAAQWQALLSALNIEDMPINIVQEDDLVAIVAEATYRVLTEHLSATDHLQRIVRQAANDYVTDKPARLRLSEPDFNLVKVLKVPGTIELECNPDLDVGAYQLEIGKAKITYALSERLSQLSAALLSARALVNG
jgi:flagellar biosynthesis/type III secretory pathway protein FliH